LGAALGLLLGFAVVAAGCGIGEVPASSASATSSAAPSAAPVGGSDLPSTQPIVVDPGLLAILPTSVDGAAIQAAPETASGMITDPDLARSASAVAVGIVVAPGASGSEELAVASVIQLRPGVFDDAFFSQWRLDYDEAACTPAGGVASHAQEVIGAHTVELTLCRQGARTYQAHLAGDVLISVTSVGDRGFGERIMAGLRR
jgi:hypothetical protein